MTSGSQGQRREVPKSLENFAAVVAEEEGVVLTHRASVDEEIRGGPGGAGGAGGRWP